MYCDNHNYEKFGMSGSTMPSTSTSSYMHTPRPSHHQQNFPSPRTQTYQTPIYAPPTYYQTSIYIPPGFPPTYAPPYIPPPTYTPPTPPYIPPTQPNTNDMYTVVGVPSSICCIILLIFLATRILPRS